MNSVENYIAQVSIDKLYSEFWVVSYPPCEGDTKMQIENRVSTKYDWWLDSSWCADIFRNYESMAFPVNNPREWGFRIVAYIENVDGILKLLFYDIGNKANKISEYVLTQKTYEPTGVILKDTANVHNLMPTNYNPAFIMRAADYVLDKELGIDIGSIGAHQNYIILENDEHGRFEYFYIENKDLSASLTKLADGNSDNVIALLPNDSKKQSLQEIVETYVQVGENIFTEDVLSLMRNSFAWFCCFHIGHPDNYHAYFGLRNFLEIKEKIISLKPICLL